MSKLSQYGILYVDDELLALKYFEKGFAQDFKVLTASNAADGWEILQRNNPEIGLVMADQRMPGQTGVELLEKIRYAYPQVVRILATAYSDVESAIAGVNAGAIYRYVGKPWDVDHLRIDLLRALEYYGVLRERDQLLREKLSVLQQIILSNRVKNLGVLAAGLRFTFRNAIPAARRFVEALPPIPPEMAATEANRPGVARNFEAVIKKACEEVFQIAASISESGRGSENFTKPISLATLLKPLESDALPDAISLSLDSNLPPLAASPAQIRKLFSSLISNVRAVAREPLRVRIAASEWPQAEGGPGVRIVFADSGAEWGSEQWLRFFTPFMPSIEPSSQLGLELAVCYFIAHHHGGRIEVRGEPDSRVIVYLATDPVAVADIFEKADLESLLHYEQGGRGLLRSSEPNSRA